MLTKETVVSQISVDEFGNISVRESTRILEDGVVLSETYHRHVIAPGDDLKDEPEEVAAIAAVAHTRERVAAKVAREEAMELVEEPVVEEPEVP